MYYKKHVCPNVGMEKIILKSGADDVTYKSFKKFLYFEKGLGSVECEVPSSVWSSTFSQWGFL